MITIVLTYRNRDLSIVKKCLDSLSNQSNKNFKVILVDYGSSVDFKDGIEELSNQYEFIDFVSCPVSGQLWSKCRAINIALKQTETSYFMVGDIDLIFHPEFIDIATKLSGDKVVYFMYGFLSKEESRLDKSFEDYNIDFLGNKEVTGTTLFPTEKLKEVNGYDEFYHGWGAEDTDVHIRIKNLGLKVEFYNEQAIVKHQWHPKVYRSKNSKSPFHSSLERVNHNYMNMTRTNSIAKTNLHNEWGKIPSELEYERLNDKPDHIILLNPVECDFTALLAQFKNFSAEVVRIEIIDVNFNSKAKDRLRKALKKKYFNYLPMEKVNNKLLEEIIYHYRNKPYTYSFDRKKGIIDLTIFF